MMKKIWKMQVLAGMLVISAVSTAQEDPRTAPSKYVYGFFGQSALILGSEDNRYGGGIGFGYGKPERRFRYKTLPAQLVVEGYIDRTRSLSESRDTTAFGVLAYSRWRFPVNERGWGIYFDAGWGLQYADKTTIDLDSHLNSTPMLGLGGAFPIGHREFLIGLRFLHISNAGLRGSNQGQNELFLTLGFRF